MCAPSWKYPHAHGVNPLVVQRGDMNRETSPYTWGKRGVITLSSLRETSPYTWGKLRGMMGRGRADRNIPIHMG